MLANLRRKVGMLTGMSTTPVPTMPPPASAESMMAPPTTFVDPGLGPGQLPFTMEELGGTWPSDRGIFNPTAIPPWLQEQVSRFIFKLLRETDYFCVFQSLTDLGLPVNGSDGIFLRMNGVHGWTGDFPPTPEAW